MKKLRHCHPVYTCTTGPLPEGCHCSWMNTCWYCPEISWNNHIRTSLRMLRHPNAYIYATTTFRCCLIGLLFNSVQVLEREALVTIGAHFTDRKLFLSTIPLCSSRHHLSYDDCLEDKRENYQKCSVLCCVRQLCTMICTTAHEQFLKMSVGLGLSFRFCAFV